jgi:hypothetical protein
LGEFAKLFSDYDPCLVTAYTLYTDTTKRKIISIARDYSSPCIVNIESIFESLDTTKYFEIHKETEPFLNETISMDSQSIDPRNLRFNVTKSDSSYAVILYINPDSASFQLTKPIVDSLPRLLFGEKLLRTKISKVYVRLRSLPGVKNETIGQLQRIFY